VGCSVLQQSNSTTNERGLIIYTALEHNRLYRIGLGEEAKTLIYIGREFPDDHPAIFLFQRLDNGERISFMIEELTFLEKEGAVEYLGASL